MANWGKKEHRWENYTNVMLILGTITSVGYLYTKWNWLIIVIIILIILSTIVHLVARTFHLLEKRYYNNRLGKR